MYIDTHAHLNFPEFKADLDETIMCAQAAKVCAIVNIALDEEAIKFGQALQRRYPHYIFNAAGIHPHEASRWNSSVEASIKELALEKQIIAIGEMGLDYFYKLAPVEIQQNTFRRQLQLAQAVDLPAVIHCRDASQDTIQILHEENRGYLKGVLHCFNGDMELAQAALKLGLLISFTGNITFPKAEKIRQAAREIPLESIMLETDCPFLAPQDFRGKRNEPAFVVKVAEKIAEVKGISVEEIAEATTANARTMFGLR
ncbi:MAG: TatD family hydrolase [Candidatus Margulisbacteria bacterium]|nr:TatD family hydrolase [Candidatus Margulisiibacteriota bacterium]